MNIIKTFHQRYLYYHLYLFNTLNYLLIHIYILEIESQDNSDKIQKLNLPETKDEVSIQIY